MRVCGIARNIDHHAQLAARLSEEFVVNEGRNRLGQVDLESSLAPQ